ncbi:unnamed protein product [Bemisia tabaci]|uniref:4-coumarate--CoA ligase n=2 Tax=Bemisia tabaci TaxID=7038 RepID=A0A9P0AL12_BEMTA|nr:unnamed protein product [Bemisia tabaci]
MVYVLCRNGRLSVHSSSDFKMASPMERGLTSLLHSILVKQQSRHGLQVHRRKINSLVAARKHASCAESDGSRSRLSPISTSLRYYSSVDANNVVHSPFPPFEPRNETIHEFLWKDIESVQQFPLIVDAENGRGYSYGGARAVSEKFAAALVKSGFKPGDVLTIVLPNMPEYPLIVLGALEAGLIVSTANPLYTEHEISHQLENSEARCIVTLPSVVPTCKKALALVKKDVPIITVSYGSERASGTWDFQDMISGNVDTSLIPREARKSEDVALLLYSSGTTGLSKGVALTHKNIVSNIEMCRVPGLPRFSTPSAEYQDVLMAVVPFFHSTGLTCSLLNGIANYGKFVSFSKFDPVSYLKGLKNQKPRSVTCVCAPPLTLFLGAHPAVTPEHLESVRYIFNGAGPVGQSDVEKLIAKRPNKDGFKFFNAYGLTETSPVVFLPKETTASLVTVGSPVSGSQVRVVDETGKNLGPNEKGELYVKGPHVMKGYHKNEAATKEAFAEDGWFRTGDMVYYDENCEFYIVERLKELIKVKGFQVPPAELESLLRSHPDVSEAAVVGAPDERAGERPVAFIVPKPGCKPDHEDVKEFVSKHVAEYKWIKEIKQVEAIPKNLSGKILRRQLKEEYLGKSS